MWLPNLLTLLRLPLAGLVWLAAEDPWWVLGIMAAAGATDVLDGWVARRIGRESPGAWLDPVCDKAFMGSVLALLFVAHAAEPWLLALIAGRELLQAVAYPWLLLRRGKRYDFRSTIYGKAATVAQFLSVAAILFHSPLAIPAAAFTAAMGGAAALHYVWRAK